MWNLPLISNKKGSSFASKQIQTDWQFISELQAQILLCSKNKAFRLWFFWCMRIRFSVNLLTSTKKECWKTSLYSEVAVAFMRSRGKHVFWYKNNSCFGSNKVATATLCPNYASSSAAVKRKIIYTFILKNSGFCS